MQNALSLRHMHACLYCFGRPFVKLSPYAIRPLPVLSVLSVCDVRALWPNGWTDPNETWHAGRPRPGNIVLDGDPSPPSPKGAQPHNFRPYLLRPNGCMDQDVTGMELGLGPGDSVLDGDLAPPP